jgi:BMFP domain-containing protein YqiC
MGLVDSLKARGTELAGRAMTRMFEDEKRAEQLGELVGMLQRGRKAVASAQEATLKGLGVASRGEVQAAGKRLAQLRKSARKLDEKLGALQSRLATPAADDSSEQASG